MRMVLDGTPLAVETGGIRRYVEQLPLALRLENPEDEIWVVSDQRLMETESLQREGIVVRDEPARGMSRRWWFSGLPRLCEEVGAEVFHGTDYHVPYRHRTPAVITIHDLSPWRDPALQPSAGRIRRRTPWLLRLGLADMVITVSEAMRRDVMAYFHLEAEQVRAVPLAADERFCAGSVADIEARAPRYLLFVGTLENRKGIRELIDVWRSVGRPRGVELWIAGRRRDDFECDEAEPGLRWMGAVSDERLPALYREALAVAYPSHYEGFGLPALEAMQCGAPLLVGSSPALKELVQDAAVTVNPGHADEFAHALKHMLEDDTLRQELRRRGLQRAKAFSWAETARRTRMVYQEAIERFAR